MECLVCVRPCDLRSETPSSPLGRQLEAVFVLRELLRLPPERLTRFLKRSGGEHPHEWIRLCDPCQLLVDKAFFFWEQLQSVKRNLGKVQHQLVTKLRDSRGGAVGIVEEIRAFVKNHDYGLTDKEKQLQFRKDDLSARRRLETMDKQNPIPQPPNIIALEDVDGAVIKTEAAEQSSDDDDQNIDHFESLANSPPPPLSPEDNATPDDVKEEMPKLTLKTKRTTSSTGTGKLFPCRSCSFVFHNKMSRWRHFNRQHKSTTTASPGARLIPPGAGRTCSLCQGTFLGRIGLANHRRKCPALATSTASQISSADNAFASLDPSRDYDEQLPCDICQDLFYGRSGLMVHKKRAHPECFPPPTRSFPCPQCSLSFTHRYLKDRHVALKHLLQPLPKKKASVKRLRQCPHCPYTAPRENVETHVKLKHEGQYPVTCEHCGKGLSTPRALRAHQAFYHFVCVVKGCGGKGESREEIYQHQVDVHGGEQYMFRCDECGTFFGKRVDLRKHQRLQGHGEGKETHVCVQCGEGFQRWVELKRHEKKIHKNK